MAQAVLAMPPSSTGLLGYISLETLKLVDQLRSAGHKYVLISGARYSTILERIPFLPKADAYVVENGGRIFFTDEPSALTPMAEDLQWRATLNLTAGTAVQAAASPSERPGLLWDTYRYLDRNGWKLDTKSYTTSFRVKSTSDAGHGSTELAEVLRKLPEGLTSSFNLGAADIYPATSGKEKAALQLLAHYNISPDKSFCMCDDDNDLKMAEVVARAYVPQITSDSMRTAIDSQPLRFSLSKSDGFEGTNEALRNILSAIHQSAD